MTKKVSDFMLERLQDWGVSRIFGYTGDSINPIMGALRRTDALQFTQVRHEEMAAFMACAHAKFTGEVGVCCASAGPGSIHLLNGLYDAKLDHQPVVALLGQVPRHAMGSDYLQEVDLHSIFKDVASAYIQVLETPEQASHLIDQAMRVALSERTVTALILPHDVQEMKSKEESPRKHGYTRSGIGRYTSPLLVPTHDAISEAADVLNAGEKVAILIGAGAQAATEEIIQVAERLNAGVAKALLGLSALPADLPYVTGSIGLLGTKPSWDMMNQCDTLLMVGSDFPYSEFLPAQGQARGVQIDLRTRNLSKRYPMEVNLVGEAKLTLQALLPLLKQKTESRWQEQIIKSVNQWQDSIKERAMIDTEQLNPQRVFYEIFERLPANAMICCDTGTSTVWYAQYHKFQRGMMGTLSGRLASMGSAMPYAVASKFAHPERPVIAFVGDGAMQMNGINGLITVARYWQEWQNPGFIVVVLNNRELNFVTWEMRAMEGDPKFNCSQNLPDFSYVEYAKSLGFKGIRMEKPEDIEPGWLEALHSEQPVVIEAYTSPDVPPIPSHITFDQARNYAKALLSGDSDAGAIFRTTLQELLHLK